MDTVLDVVNHHFVDPVVLQDTRYHPNESYSFYRQFLVMWGILYLGTMLMYFTVCSIQYYFFFSDSSAESFTNSHPEVTKAKQEKHPVRENPAQWIYDGAQVKDEIWISTWSVVLMTMWTAPIEVVTIMGWGNVYDDVEEYGWTYFVLSPVLFLIFTDSLIYWIHRYLHHPWFYWIHKLHHKYKETTPYSAFSFHPLDGWLQGVPYHIFVFCFPFHRILYAVALVLVGLWTANIHDRMTLRIPGVNGAGHHLVHHVGFDYNYGQYLTFWDRMCGSFLDPYAESPYNGELLPCKKGQKLNQVTE